MGLRRSLLLLMISAGLSARWRTITRGCWKRRQPRTTCSRSLTAAEIVTSFHLGYADGTLAEKLPAEGRRALRRVGVLTGSGRELLRGCVVFPLVNAATGQVVNLYGRSIEGRRHLYLPGERRGVFNPQGARNTEEVIVTESVIDAAALWSAGLRNVIPTYGTTGLTDEIVSHLVECRVKRVVLMMDTDEAGRAAAVEMGQRLAAVNIEARSVELPAKDASEFLVNGGSAEDIRALLTGSAGVPPAVSAPARIDLFTSSTSLGEAAAQATLAPAGGTPAVPVLASETAAMAQGCLRSMAVSIAFVACRRWVWSG